MFRPIGSQPPSVYWRRRIIVLGSIVLLLVLLVLTIKAASSNGDGKPVGDGSTSAPPTTSTTPNALKTTPSTKQSSKHSTSKSSKHSTSPPRKPSSSAPPARCQLKSLAVDAVVAKSSYQVGSEPVVELQVTNTGAKPCVQDLADRQIELKVYNGESRVWGSHDCEIKDGTDDRMLAVNRPVRVSITWSGLTSQPKCAGTRQRVGAGTYTLYAVLSGKTGKATQFAIS